MSLKDKLPSFVGAVLPLLPLASFGGPESNQGETTIVFDPPVQPGTTLTMVLGAERNPSRSGTYWFGITA